MPLGTSVQIAVDDVAITRIAATDAIRERITFRADLTLTMSTHHVDGDHPEEISGWCEGSITDVGILIEAERFDVGHLIVPGP